MRIRYKILSYSIIAMLLFSGGYLIAVYSNGGTPTIDTTGLSNFPWFNASVGVNAPEFYLNGALLSQMETARYIISKDGSTYYAKSGITGKIDYRGTNAATVIQNAIDAVTSGGTIYFGTGVFEINTMIELTSTASRRITLEGTKGSELKASDSANLSAIIKVSQSHKENLIKGLTINGNKQNVGSDRGIWIVSPSGVTTTWIEVRDCSFIKNVIGIDLDTESGGGACEHILIQGNEFGVHSYPNNVGIRMDLVKAIRIESNIFEDCDDVSVLFVNQVKKVIVLGNHFDDALNYAIKLESYASGNIISNNFFEDTVNYDHIYLSSSCADNTIIGNTAQTCSPGRDVVHVEGQRNVISNNAFYENTNGDLIKVMGNLNVITDNTLVSGTDGIDVGGDNCIITGNLLKTNNMGLRVSGTGNRIQDNVLDGNTVVSSIADGNKVSSIIIPFIDGSVVHDQGFWINGAAEYARAWFQMPEGVQQILRMKIYGRSNINETHTMLIEIYFYASALNEIYNTHYYHGTNVQSDTSNFGNEMPISWVITNANVLALTSGDSVILKVLYESASGDDGATNIMIRSVEIEYI